MAFRHINTAFSKDDLPLRLVTNNIHKGVQGIGPLKRLEIHNLKDAVEQLGADIVCLQEVRRFNTQLAKRFKNWPHSPQAEFLAPSGYFCAYTTNAVTQHGEHGNAVLSKWPILRNQHEDMSDHRLEQRGLLHVVIDYKGDPIHVIVLHLGLLARSRKRQIDQLRDFIEREIKTGETLIVAGDFNDWSNALAPLIEDMGLTLSVASSGKGTVEGTSQLHGAGKRVGRRRTQTVLRTPTFPARLPLLQLDYVYSRGLHTSNCYTPVGKHWAGLSDHLPLIVEFDQAVQV